MTDYTAIQASIISLLHAMKRTAVADVLEQACDAITELRNENHRLRKALAAPCRFAPPCGGCEACHITRKILEG